MGTRTQGKAGKGPGENTTQRGKCNTKPWGNGDSGKLGSKPEEQYRQDLMGKPQRGHENKREEHYKNALIVKKQSLHMGDSVIEEVIW